MYEAFYGLQAKPFSILPNPHLIYWGRMHRLAYAMLEFGVLNQAGFTVITGEIGSGKTTLIHHLLSKLPKGVTPGLINNTPQGRDELLRWIMLAFGQAIEGEYLIVFRRFQEFLLDHLRAKRTAILVIDEAQNLGLESLEFLRMLSNINTTETPVLQLILVGQPQLREQLRDPILEQFAQRVAVDFHLKALEEKEVAGYIESRLAAAGARRQIFADQAIAVVAKKSRGIPRIINILCDTALVYGLATQAPVITPDIVEEVIADRQTYGVLPIGNV
jgi:general secretion pathway protein A